MSIRVPRYIIEVPPTVDYETMLSIVIIFARNNRTSSSHRQAIGAELFITTFRQLCWGHRVKEPIFDNCCVFLRDPPLPAPRAPPAPPQREL